MRKLRYLTGVDKGACRAGCDKSPCGIAGTPAHTPCFRLPQGSENLLMSQSIHGG
jgi:hypothetical protein